MATAQHLKALLRSYADGNEEQFYATAMRVVAHEARHGHDNVAKELRALIDESKKKKGALELQVTPLAKPKGELSGLLAVQYPAKRLHDLVLNDETVSRLKRLIREHHNINKLRAHNLSPRKKLLLVGPPGTGKTMTASVLAGELGLPLFVVRLDGLVTKFMGETSAKLRLIFDAIQQTRGVYLFDEFDSIGSHRGLTNDVGEIRRVLNSFLLMLEEDSSNSLLVAATNHVELLDHALFRRFDDVIEYVLPTSKEIASAMKNRLANFPLSKVNWKLISEEASGLSYAEITRACDDAMKDAILKDRETIKQSDLILLIKERKMNSSYKQPTA